MKQLTEVRNEFIDEDQNLNYIDGYITSDDNEEGFTVAVVDRDTKKVIWFRNEYRTDPLALESINEILEEIK